MFGSCPLANSDHVVITGKLTESPRLSKADRYITFQDFKSADWVQINSFLKGCIHFRPSNDPADLYEWIYATVQQAIETYVPLKTVYKFRSYFISASTMRLYRRPRRQYLKYRSSGNLKFLYKYKYLRSRVSRLIKQSADNFEKSLANSKNNKYFNFVKNKRSFKQTIKCLSLNDGSIIEDPAAIATALNYYFISVYNKNVLDIHVDNHIWPHEKVIISKTTLNAALKRFAKSKGCGIDKIPISFWLNLCPEFINVLLDLFNAIANSNYIPSHWNTMLIYPL